MASNATWDNCASGIAESSSHAHFEAARRCATHTVTIVTPSLNQGEFIRATIDSVLSQDYPHIEYIVMDGGSTDQTPVVAAEYGSRLTWISEKDRGQSHAINKGFSMARGEIVAWLNSDDILLPGAVRRAVDALAKAPAGIGGIYGEGYLMDRAGEMTGRFPATEPFNLWKLVYLSDYILQQSTFFRRSAVSAVGWLDESLHYAMDWDLLIKIGARFGMQYVPAYLGALREYPEAKSFAGGRKRIEEIRRVLKRHTGLEHAPGYWTYGLEMLRERWKTSAENVSSAWLRAPARMASIGLRGIAGIPIMLIHRQIQGLYTDRWVSDRLKWMVPAQSIEAIVRGQVPDGVEFEGQVLSVRSEGRELGRWPVGHGKFTLRFPTPRHSDAPFQFEVRARRYKRPRLSSEGGPRRLAWILEEIDWTITPADRSGVPAVVD